MIPISKPTLGKEEEKAVINVLKSGIIASGPKVKEFEEKFSKKFKFKYSIATSSGTSALHSALFALNIKKGDKIITPAFTFIATVNSILYQNAEPIFVDVEEDTFNISPADIEQKLKKEKNIRAMIVVHLYGHMADMEKIKKMAQKYKVKIIEDAAQAHGAKYLNKYAGSFSEIACFSFYATKNMTTGEGGMVVTSKNLYNKKVREFINHGQNKQYYHKLLGYNYRMTDIEAAIGIEQLKKIDFFNAKRRRNAEKLKIILKNYDWIVLPKEKKHYFHIYHQFTIRVNRKFRNKLLKFLNENKIGAKIFYPLPIYKQPIYRDRFKNIYLPTTEKLIKEVISLPIHPSLNDIDIEKIGDAFKKFSKKI